MVNMTAIEHLLSKHTKNLMSKVPQHVHEVEFEQMKLKANRPKGPTGYQRKGPRRDSRGRTTEEEHTRRLDAYLKHKGDKYLAAKEVNMNPETYTGWFRRYGKYRLPKENHLDDI